MLGMRKGSGPTDVSPSGPDLDDRRANPRVTPVVEERGFALVEEGDVAFALALCREINRWYSLYQNGELSADSRVRTGLDLTTRMLVTLQSVVMAGMPSMRLQVAGAQAREMMAVLFGDELSTQVPKLPPSWGDVRTETPPAAIRQAPIPSPVLPSVPAGRGSTDRSRMGALSWYRRYSALRFVVGLGLCLAAAVLIDVPIAIMALVPNHLTEIGAVYALVALTVCFWSWRRKKTVGRLAGADTPDEYPGPSDRGSAVHLADPSGSVPVEANPSNRAKSPVEAA